MQPLEEGTHALPQCIKPGTHTQAKGASGSALSCLRSPLQLPTPLAAHHAHAPTLPERPPHPPLLLRCSTFGSHWHSLAKTACRSWRPMYSRSFFRARNVSRSAGISMWKGQWAIFRSCNPALVTTSEHGAPGPQSTRGSRSSSPGPPPTREYTVVAAMIVRTDQDNAQRAGTQAAVLAAHAWGPWIFPSRKLGEDFGQRHEGPLAHLAQELLKESPRSTPIASERLNPPGRI